MERKEWYIRVSYSSRSEVAVVVMVVVVVVVAVMMVEKVVVLVGCGVSDGTRSNRHHCRCRHRSRRQSGEAGPSSKWDGPGRIRVGAAERFMMPRRGMSVRPSVQPSGPGVRLGRDGVRCMM